MPGRPRRRLFIDQRWIDLAPGLWPRSASSATPPTTSPTGTCTTAARNRRRRLPGRRRAAAVLPLQRLRLAPPHELSKHQTRIKLRDDPALSRICDEYGERPARARRRGGADLVLRLGPGGRTGSASTASPAASTATRRQRPPQRLGLRRPRRRALPAYLAATIHGSNEAAVNRYATALWESRQDLRDVFPDIEGASAVAYLEWMRRLRRRDRDVGRPAARPHRSRTATAAPAPRRESRRAQGRGQRGRLRQFRARSRRGGAPDDLGARVAPDPDGGDRHARPSRARSSGS